jgi:uncharacterized membrane protein
MELDRNQKTLAGIILIIGAVTAIVSLPNILNGEVPKVCTIDGECQHEAALRGLINLTPLILFAGVVLGVVAFYFLYERKKPEVKVIDNTKDTSAAADLLDDAEAKVLKKIVAEKGRVLQAEVSRLEGVGKVKAHRILARLEKRGVIESEGAGKTNIIKLTETYRKLFLE